MALPEQKISTQFKGKTTTRREPMTLSEGMQRIKARLEMRTEERRQVADKIRSLTTEGKTGMLHESKTPRIAVVEKGTVVERTEAERQRKTWRQQEEAEMADVVKRRSEQAYDEAAEAQRNEEAHAATFAGLEDYKRWEAVQQSLWLHEKMPDFWANRERMDKENAAEIRAQLAKDRREKDSDRKENKRASHYRIRDLIAKGVLKKLKTSFKHLNDILTGVALDENGKYITKEGEARAEKWVTEPGMKDEFKPYLSLSMHDLKQTAYAFVREAKDRIALADKRFNDASIENWKEGHGHWTVGRSVGWRRSEKGVHYNQLVDDKVFIAAVARYSGTAKKVSKKTDAGNRLMLQAIVMNHWISQKLALEGNTHKMREFYKERNNALREAMMEKFNVLSTSSTAGERLALEKDLERAKEILQDDARYAEEQMEHFRNLDRPMVDFWQEMADAGLGHLMPEGDVAKQALTSAMNYLSNDIREQWERDAVAERRARIEDQKSAVRRRASDALERKMTEIHGEGWLGATARDKETMLDTYILGNRGEYGRPTTPRGMGPHEPGRPIVPDDLEKGFREQMDYIEHGKPLSPEGRAYRLNMLMERSDQIMDEIEADPKRASDPRVTDELRLLENEVRRHYEDAVPEAKDKEFGIGRVLENGVDLSKPGNLPRGAYVRRVSDYLKEGQRGIRSGLDRVEGKLRNHLLDVAQRTVGDMEVVALTAEQMDMAAREKGLPGDTPSFYDPNSHRVFISQRTLHGADRDRVLGHELAHPLTLRAAEMFPGIAKKLNEQLQLLRDAFYKPSDRAHGEVHRALDGHTQALDNIHEFIGELYNDGGRVAQALHAIETPGDLRKAWRTDTLANAFGDVLATIKNGLHKLLFQSSKKRLLNDATLNSLHLFDRLEAAGMYTPPHGRYEALPYKPKREMGNEEAQRWSSYPVHRIADVFDRGFTGKGRSDGGASFAVKEDGQIHDVGLHDKHTSNLLKARGLPTKGFKHFDPFLSPKHATYRPWMHISKWTSADGTLALGLEYSEHRTAAQDAVLKKVIAEGNKARRRGENIYLITDEYRHLEGRDYASDEGIRQAIKGGFDADKLSDADLMAEANKIDDADLPSFEDMMKRVEARKADEARINSMTTKMEGEEFMQWARARTKDDPFLNRTLKLIAPLIKNDLRVRIYDPKIWPELPSNKGGVLGSYHDMVHDVMIPMDASPKTIVHEMVHAATSRALERNKIFKAQIRGIMAEIEAHPIYKEWYSKQEFRDNAVHPDYFMKDPHEFIAEFYASPHVRELLDQIPASQKLISTLRESTMFQRPSMFRMLMGLITKYLRSDLKKAGGLNVGLISEKLIGDVLRAQKEMGPYKRTNWLGEDIPGQPTRYSRTGPDPSRKPTSMEEVTTSASEGWKDVKFRLQRMGVSGALLKASTFVELRRRAEEGMQHVVRGVEDVWSKVETTARNMFRDSGAEDIAMAIANQMRMPAAVFQKLQDYVNLENHWKVSGEDPLHEGKNSWVSKDSPYHEHYRTRHETLSRMYDELSPDQKELRRRMLDYYESQHDKVLRANLTKVIQLRDMVPGGDRETSDALIKHVLKEDLSTHEKTLLDKIPGYESEIDLTNKTPEHIRFRNNMRELRGNPLFKKVEGVWYPAKRRGNYVVEGRYDLSGEAERFGGRKVDENGNTWEFDDADKAQKFYEAVSGSEAYGGIHFEGKTEHVYQADEHGNPKLDSEGKPIPETYYSERTTRKGERPDPSTPDAEKVPFTETTTGGHRRVTAKEAEGEPGTVTRHRVEFNPLLLEFYENPRHAYERHAELQGDANLKLTHVEPKRDTSGTYLDPKKASKVMETLFNSLERGRGWEEMDPTTRALTRRDLEEAAVQHIMSSSARSMRIPRRYALGADKSLLRDFNDYAHNAQPYLGGTPSPRRSQRARSRAWTTTSKTTACGRRAATRRTSTASCAPSCRPRCTSGSSRGPLTSSHRSGPSWRRASCSSATSTS